MCPAKVGRQLGGSKSTAETLNPLLKCFDVLPPAPLDEQANDAEFRQDWESSTSCLIPPGSTPERQSLFTRGKHARNELVERFLVVRRPGFTGNRKNRRTRRGNTTGHRATNPTAEQNQGRHAEDAPPDGTPTNACGVLRRESFWDPFHSPEWGLAPTAIFRFDLEGIPSIVKSPFGDVHVAQYAV